MKTATTAVKYDTDVEAMLEHLCDPAGITLDEAVDRRLQVGLELIDLESSNNDLFLRLKKALREHIDDGQQMLRNMKNKRSKKYKAYSDLTKLFCAYYITMQDTKRAAGKIKQMQNPLLSVRDYYLSGLTDDETS